MMSSSRVLVLLLVSACGFAATAAAQNRCQANGTTCPTGMPLDGYCECVVHGVAKSGTVVPASTPHAYDRVDHRHPDCHAMPDAPGCAHR